MVKSGEKKFGRPTNRIKISMGTQLCIEHSHQLYQQSESVHLKVRPGMPKSVIFLSKSRNMNFPGVSASLSGSDDAIHLL